MPHVSQRLIGGETRPSKPSSHAASAGLASVPRHRKVHSDTGAPHVGVPVGGELSEGEARWRRRISLHHHMRSNERSHGSSSSSSSSSGDEQHRGCSSNASGLGLNGDGDTEGSADSRRSFPSIPGSPVSHQHVLSSSPSSSLPVPPSPSLEEAQDGASQISSDSIAGHMSSTITHALQIQRQQQIAEEKREDGAERRTLSVEGQRDNKEEDEVVINSLRTVGLRQRRPRGSITEEGTSGRIGANALLMSNVISASTHTKEEREIVMVATTMATVAAAGQVIDVMKESWTCPVCLQSFDEPCMLPDCKSTQ